MCNLSCEFFQVIVTNVYMSPTAHTKEAVSMIADHVHDLENCTPDVAKIVTGDFNHCDLNKALPGYQQQVMCTTHGDRTLDLFYRNIKDAYTSALLPPLGRSDHNLVSLLLRYKPRMQREPPVMKTLRKWTKDAWDALKGCFDCTDWSVFTDTSGPRMRGTP